MQQGDMAPSWHGMHYLALPNIAHSKKQKNPKNGHNRVSFATPLAQFLGEQWPSLTDEGQFILPTITMTPTAGILCCHPMHYEWRLCMIVDTF